MIEKEITFRSATMADSKRIWQIIQDAKEYMKSEGRNQWNDEYPNINIVETDIANGFAHVLCVDNEPMVYGAVVFTGEPAYDELDGTWLSNSDYVVLHRLCVAKEGKGLGLGRRYFHEVEKLALQRGIHSFKIDTNYDNAEMLHLLLKLGFEYCGEVIYEQGKRKAFEKLISKNNILIMNRLKNK